MALWKFKPFTEDDTRENPTQSQFFTTNEVKNISNGLIREGIQNALDEQLEKKDPVVIKITICDAANGLEPSQYFKYLSGLEEHLYSTDNALRDLPNLTTDKMGFLVFEDFNTK